MTELAKSIVVRRTGVGSERGSYEFTIDGEPFPWHISANGLQLNVTNDDMPSVTFTLLAERVEVLHTLAAEQQEPE